MGDLTKVAIVDPSGNDASQTFTFTSTTPLSVTASGSTVYLTLVADGVATVAFFMQDPVVGNDESLPLVELGAGQAYLSFIMFGGPPALYFKGNIFPGFQLVLTCDTPGVTVTATVAFHTLPEPTVVSVMPLPLPVNLNQYVPVAGRLPVVDNPYTEAFDYDANNNPIYIGLAAPGSSKAVNLWQIRKITYDVNKNPTDIQYANGSTAFNAIWNNRTTLAYS